MRERRWPASPASSCPIFPWPPFAAPIPIVPAARSSSPTLPARTRASSPPPPRRVRSAFAPVVTRLRRRVRVAGDLIVRRRDARGRGLGRAARSSTSPPRSPIASSSTPDGAVFLDADGSTHLVGSEAGLATALVARAARVGLDGARGRRVEHDRRAARGPARARHRGRAAGRGARLPGAAAARAVSRRRPTSPRRSRAGASARSASWRGFPPPRSPRGSAPTARRSSAPRAARTSGRSRRSRSRTPSRRRSRSSTRSTPSSRCSSCCTAWSLRAIERLGLAGTGCAELGLALDLDDRSRDARTIPLVAPTRDVKTLLTCLRVDARSAAAARGDRARRADGSCRRACARRSSASSRPPGPRPSGSRRRSRAWACSAAPAASARPSSSTRTVRATPAWRRSRSTRTPRRRHGDRAAVPARRPRAPPAAAARGLHRARRAVLRARHRARRPRRRRRRARGASPTEWWSDAACARDYYDLELTDGGIYRCFRDRRSGAWFVDGAYD